MSESEAKSVRRLLIFLGGMVAFAVVLLILAKVIVSLTGGTQSVDEMTQAQIQQRIAPVGKDYIAGKSKPPAPQQQKQASAGASQHKQLTGKQVVQNTCSACHGTGAMGAPKIGSKKDWKPRFEKGKQTLYQHAENGFKAMPPRGGHSSYSNAEIKAAVNYMLKQAGLE
ncbi:MAG TPA: c-type cytochrome [Gammaproteobacteria bacterium]|nr:c-type cytochrome [Gammaproteobacteria bacterium]